VSEGAAIPQCGTCPHGWHGLPCERHIYTNPTHPYQTGRCPCAGPYATNHQETAP
jgi:hypothetical protein